MPLKARQRSRLAVLAVLALVGSLLAVSAVPVAAEDGKMDHEATYSACVGPAAEDAGFTDTDGNTHEAAINCLAHYGITMGTSEGVYSPSAAVTRVQMALFLHRAAAPAGIDLPAASDQGFTDIGNWSDAAQDAVNLMAELGIMSGRSSTEFMPTDLVTRADMSVHIAEFLSDALTGPGGTDIDDDGFEADDTVFTDINNATKSAYDAIRDLYELGVTNGLTETTYGPEGLVTRAQMASYITRALAHTNARPAGLTVQTKSTNVFAGEEAEFVASVRDVNHLPKADAFVDYFYLIEDGDDGPFDDDGACTDDVMAPSAPCEVTSDPSTDVDGNVSDLTVPTASDSDKDIMVWFWTGELGDEFDEDDDETVAFEINVSPDAVNTQATVSHNYDTNKAKFGETVTLMIQLVDGDNMPVARHDVEVTVSLQERMPDGSQTTSTKMIKTDSSGKIEMSWKQDDPESEKVDEALDDTTVATDDELLEDTSDKGEYGVILIDVTPAEDTDLVNDEGDAYRGDGGSPGDPHQFNVMWDDDPSVPTSLKLSTARKYAKASDKGRGVSNTVRATLTDQYGDGVNRVKVEFTSTGAGGTKGDKDTPYLGASDLSKSTNRSGVASLSYQRDSDSAATESFTAHYREERGTRDETCGTANTGETPDDINDLYCRNTAEALVFHWAVAPSSDTSGIVSVVDKAANIAVVGTGGDAVYIEWDSDDSFTHDGSAVLLSEFEKEITVGDTLAWVYTGEDDDGEGVATFALT